VGVAGLMQNLESSSILLIADAETSLKAFLLPSCQ